MAFCHSKSLLKYHNQLHDLVIYWSNALLSSMPLPKSIWKNYMRKYTTFLLPNGTIHPFCNSILCKITWDCQLPLVVMCITNALIQVSKAQNPLEICSANSQIAASSRSSGIPYWILRRRLRQWCDAGPAGSCAIMCGLQILQCRALGVRSKGCSIFVCVATCWY